MYELLYIPRVGEKVAYWVGTIYRPKEPVIGHLAGIAYDADNDILYGVIETEDTRFSVESIGNMVLVTGNIPKKFCLQELKKLVRIGRLPELKKVFVYPNSYDKMGRPLVFCFGLTHNEMLYNVTGDIAAILRRVELLEGFVLRKVEHISRAFRRFHLNIEVIMMMDKTIDTCFINDQADNFFDSVVTKTSKDI